MRNTWMNCDVQGGRKETRGVFDALYGIKKGGFNCDRGKGRRNGMQ